MNKLQLCTQQFFKVKSLYTVTDDRIQFDCYYNLFLVRI